MQAGAGLQLAQAGAGLRRRPLHASCLPTLQPSHWLKLLPQYVNALSPPIAGEWVGVGGGVETVTYWRPTVPNPHASPNV